MEVTRRQGGLVYIAGTGRCGSTVLDLLLGSRSDVSGLGELYAMCEHPDTRLCGCGVPVLSCSYWRGIADKLRRMHPGAYPDRVWAGFLAGVLPDHRVARRLPALLELLLLLPSFVPIRLAATVDSSCRTTVRMARDVFRLVDAACEHDGSRWVVDSSKHAKRMKSLYLDSPERTRIVHLVRDGRAAAARSKREGENVEVGIRRWRRQTNNTLLLLRTVHAAHVMTMRYETLCDATEEQYQRLCSFLGLAPSEGEARIARREWHNIPGNSLLFADVSAIRKDERWKNELTTGELQLFDRLAGRLNRRLGY